MADRLPNIETSGTHLSFETLAAILTDPDVRAGKHLPQEEQDEHRRCLQSVVDARRYAEAHAHEWVVWR